MKAATAQKAVGDLGNVLAPSDLRQEYFQRALTDTENLVSVVYGAGKVVAAVARTSRSYNQHWGTTYYHNQKTGTLQGAFGGPSLDGHKIFREPLVWRRACVALALWLPAVGPRWKRELLLSGSSCWGHPTNILGREGTGHGHLRTSSKGLRLRSLGTLSGTHGSQGEDDLWWLLGWSPSTERPKWPECGKLKKLLHIAAGEVFFRVCFSMLK